MRLNSRFAVVAALSLGLASATIGFGSPAFAMDLDTRIPSGGCNSDHVCEPGGGGNMGCVTACTPIVAKVNYKDCSDKLTELPRITGRQIAEIAEQRVHLAPVCDFSNTALTDQQVQFLQRGNVAGLEPAIESNPLLMQQLATHGFKPKDVLGILLGSNAAVLYVHKI